MYFVEIWDAFLEARVALGTAPVDTLVEAKVWAVALIRKRFQMKPVVLHRFSKMVYSVSAADKCIGFVKIKLV